MSRGNGKIVTNGKIPAIKSINQECHNKRQALSQLKRLKWISERFLSHENKNG